MWVAGDEVSFHFWPLLNRAEIDYANKINKTYQDYNFGKGVSFNRVEKEDFCFEGM